MVFEAHGFSVSQQRVVAETMGMIINLPAGPYQMAASLNRVWTDDRGRKFSVQAQIGGVMFQTMESDLADNSPLIIGTHGHAMVITSLNYTQAPFGKNYQVVTVADPATGTSKPLDQRDLAMMTFLARISVTPLPDPVQPPRGGPSRDDASGNQQPGDDFVPDLPSHF